MHHVLQSVQIANATLLIAWNPHMLLRYSIAIKFNQLLSWLVGIRVSEITHYYIQYLSILFIVFINTL